MENITIGSVGILCKTFLKLFTNTTLIGHSNLKASLARPNNKPLITYSNHYSTLDDPLVWGILPFKFLFFPSLPPYSTSFPAHSAPPSANSMRYALGAADILFTNPLYSAFFTLGRVLRVERGGGLKQKAIIDAVNILRNGGWIHIYPQGKVCQRLSSFKWGIAELILQCRSLDPIVLPMFVEGMDRILPLGRLIPRLWQDLTVVFGEPVDWKSVISSDDFNDSNYKYNYGNTEFNLKNHSNDKNDNDNNCLSTAAISINNCSNNSSNVSAENDGTDYTKNESNLFLKTDRYQRAVLTSFLASEIFKLSQNYETLPEREKF